MRMREYERAAAYTKLKNSVILSVDADPNSENLVRRYKEIYSMVINSARRSEQIRTIVDLLQLLEKRCELAEESVVILKTIARALQNGSNLEAEITSYIENFLNSSIQTSTTYYDNDPKKIDPEQSPNISQISSKKRQMMYDRIFNEIGTYWKNLARCLDIREGQIQKIQAGYGNPSDRVAKVLEIAERNNEPQRWFFILCDALEAARRKDLRKCMQEIMTMKI